MFKPYKRLEHMYNLSDDSIWKQSIKKCRKEKIIRNPSNLIMNYKYQDDLI